jgi:GntR family transcriptional regulator
LKRLEDRKIINKSQGRGTFVSHGREYSDLSLQALGFSEHMKKTGHIPSSKVLRAEFCIPSAKVKKVLGLKPQSRVFHLCRVRLSDGEICCLEDTFVRLGDQEVCDEDWGTASLYTILDKKYSMRIQYTQERISAVNIGKEEGDLLDLASGMAALSLETIGFNNAGVPVLFSHTIRRSDTFEYIITINRNDA